jgi:hypothetical protein
MRQLTTLTMLLWCVYQLGACPCGCLEHNAWAELIGLTSHDEVASVSPAGGAVLSTAEDHDCTGQPRPLYLSSTENPGRLVALVASPPTAAFDAQPPRSMLDRAIIRAHRGPPGLGSQRAHLASLQVFLL